MKKHHIPYFAAAMLIATLCIGCACTTPQQTQVNSYDEEEAAQPAHRNPVFSLFESENSYHVYRDGERISSFTLSQGRRPIDIRTRYGDCYILVSESRHTDTTDTSFAPAEILKNGRKAMILDDALTAISFDMDEGHFYVLGRLGDSVNTIYRDGLRIHSFPVQNDRRPVDMFVYEQSIYLAWQHGRQVDIYKDNNKILSHPGICKDLAVSLRGVYLLTNDSLFHDDQLIMYNEYYRNADRELYATPIMIAVNDKDIVAGCRSSFDKEHTYSCIFLNQQPYATIKPDEQSIGRSKFSTRCCGVAVSGETLYYATINLAADMLPMQPYTFRYHTDHDESFAIKFGEKKATLLMMASD